MKFLFLFLISSNCLAAISLAFIEMKNSNGEIIQFEKGGRFAHMAISYGNMWLHAYPPNGVQLVTIEQLKKIGSIEIIVLKDVIPLNASHVKPFIGKPFDFYFSWDDQKIYCAELVAKLLKIDPRPMDFSASIWPENYKKFHGRPGISPDDIYKQLLTAQ